MAKQYLSMRNLRFQMFEVQNAVGLNQYERYQDYDQDAFSLAMDAAKQIGDQYLFPIYREMDKNKAYYENGVVHVHPELKAAIKAIADGGWIAAPMDYDKGGQQMPVVLLNAGLFIFYSANANAAAYAFLTQGAANLINTFGSEELQSKYLGQMFSGDWQGTMALTEPQAGSSLSDLVTSATPQAEGHYSIKGQKIYISSGDHTAADNVVHLLLARIDGAPAGTRGISLFVVPKFREEEDGLVSNGVTTSGIYGKMGQKGYVAAHLMLGEQEECRGYLVGKEHHGLSYMFQMMNEARIGTGNLSCGNASAAYYASLQYANERPQGRHPDNKDLTQPPVLIIEHADVRRMLLMQKAVTEGSLGLILKTSYLMDLAHVAEGEEAKRAHLLLETLTPIVKSYSAEMAIHSVSAGMQVLGGAGYTDDFPLEQYYRDVRINSIYEGTTTIHGMDLLGRKVMMDNGGAFRLFMEEVQKVIGDAAGLPALKQYAQDLGERAKALHEVTLHLTKIAATEGPRAFLADATIYLEFFSLVTIGWIWLEQGVVAEKALAGAEGEEKAFYEGKKAALHYYFCYELPKSLGMEHRLRHQDGFTVQVESAHIN